MRPPSSRGKRAFVDVSVVDVAQGSVVEHQTVVVDGDRIQSVGPAGAAQLPPQTRVVRRSGGFLMPGLADLHVHLGGEAEMLLFLLNGVTTVRNMWGFSRHLAWRRGIEGARILGPNLYTTGPIVDGSPPYWNVSVPVATAEEAALEVRRQAAAGFSAVKVYSHLSAASYAAIVAEAAARGMPVVGHIPREVPLSDALRAKQRSLEHLEGWVEALQSEKAPWKGRPMKPEEYARSGEFLEASRIPELAQEVARSDSWSCPTLVVFESFSSPAEVAERRARVEMRWCPPSLIAAWDPTKDFRFRSIPQAFWDSRPAIIEGRRAFVRALRAAGGKMLIGTDTPNPWVVPGFSLHDELDRMVQCGYSNLDVLRIATQGAAEFLGTPGEFGVVAPGARADLLLVDGDPLRDLSYARHPRAVMVRGHWLPQDELERLSGELLRSYSTSRRRVKAAVDGYVPPPPGDARTYRIEAFGELVGVERLWGSPSGADGRRTARLALDAPPGVSTVDSEWNFRGPSEVHRLRTKLGFFEGHDSIAISRRKNGYTIRDSTGGASGGRTGFVTANAEALLGPIQVASFLPLAPALRALGPGETLERDVIRIELEAVQVATGKLTAKREPSGADAAVSNRRYALEEKWSNGTFSGSVELSADGELLSLRWLGGTQELVWTPSAAG